MKDKLIKIFNGLGDVGTALLVPAIIAWLVQIISDAYLQSLRETEGVILASEIWYLKYSGWIAFVICLLFCINTLLDNWNKK